VGDVAQAVEHLLCKCEALSSNSSPINKRKKEVDPIDIGSRILVTKGGRGRGGMETGWIVCAVEE
jgi:hypothetical protein